MRAALLALYGEQGVVDGESALELPDRCADAAACWKSNEQRYDSCGIALPWIGSEYGRSRVMVVGENLNAGSDLYALAGEQGYVPEARRELLIRRRVRFGNHREEYAGTLLWHCIGVYGAVILAERGVSPFAETDLTSGEISAQTVIAAYEHIAYLNHVKCSPKDGVRSQPNLAMWSRCGRRFLAPEIEILAPQVILALGRGQNGRRLAELLADRWSEIQMQAGPVTLRRFERDTRRLDLIVVPHPSYYAVSWRATVSALTEYLRRMQGEVHVVP